MALTYAQALTQYATALLGHILLIDFGDAEWLAARDDLRVLTVGNYGSNVKGAFAAAQKRLGDALEPSLLRSVQEACLFDIAKAAGHAGDSIGSLDPQFQDYFHGTGRSTAAITGITKADPGVVTSAGHGLANGDRVWLDVAGMTEVNRRSFPIANVTTDTFELSGENTTSYGTFTSGRWTQVDAVESRELTFGAISAGPVNVGDGLLHRLTVDRWGYPLESTHVETKTARCVNDASQVEQHSEEFLISGVAAEPDFLKVTGSGRGSRLQGLNTRHSESFVVNPAFTSFAGDAPTAGSPVALASETTITGWVFDGTGGVSLSADILYRNLPGETRKISIRFEQDRVMTQVLGTERRAQFLPLAAYWRQIAVYRRDNCDGNFIFRFGTVTVTVDMTTLTNSAWNVVAAVLDRDLYGVNFAETNMAVEFELNGRTAGSAHIADFVCARMPRVDGLPWRSSVGRRHSASRTASPGRRRRRTTRRGGSTRCVGARSSRASRP